MNLSQSTDNVLSNTDKFVFRTNHIIGNGSVQIACVCQTQDCKKEVIFFWRVGGLEWPRAAHKTFEHFLFVAHE